MINLGAALLLGSARIWALLRVQASWRAALGLRWEWIAAAVAVAVAGLALGRGQLGGAVLELGDPATLVVSLGFEIVLGSVLGLAVSLPGWALVGAARETELQLELRGGGGGDGDGGGSLATLVIVASLAAGLGLGLHRPLLAGLLGSFDRFALGRPGAWAPLLEAGTPWLAEQLVAITALALALATPVLLTRVLVEIGAGSLARVGFEAASLSAALTPALRLAGALVALGAAWSAYPEAFARGL